jgi:D-amino-acid dehydrogenase
MRIAVIGAGIVGVTTAYELAADGHEVAVFERSGSVAAEGSFANGGLIAPGACVAWPHARPVGAGLVHRFGHAAPPSVSGPLLARLGWSLRAWRTVSSDPDSLRARSLLALATHSLSQLQGLRHQLGLDYEHAQGHLLLLRSAKELTALKPSLLLLEQLGVAHQLLDPARCLRAEPGLNPDTALHGGVLLGEGEVGNCRQFALLLRQEAQRLGARFRFHTQVMRIDVGDKPQLLHAYTPPDAGSAALRDPAGSGSSNEPDTQTLPKDPMLERFDAIVVCAAAASVPLLEPLGIKPPLASLHGISITAPLRQIEAHPDFGPRASVLDARFGVTISRIGQRVRLCGGAALGKADAISPRIEETLHRVLHDWFPGATQGGAVQRWIGARAQLADGLPLLGPSGRQGLWLNFGHGNQGWALACGSARLLADQLGGRPTALQPEVLQALAPSRLR